MEEKNTIGTLLINARTSKDISLEEIANKTKININILRSLEANDIEKLPNKTYVKGFVQNYARVVGLDITTASNALNDTYNQQGHFEENVETDIVEEVVNELTPEQLATREKFVNLVHNFLDRKTILTVFAVILAVILVKGILNFFTKVSNEQVKIAKTSDEIKTAEKDLFEMEAAKKLQAEVLNEEKKDEVIATSEIKEETNVQDVVEKAEEEEKEENTEEIANLPEGKFPFKKFSPAPQNMYEVLPNAEENFDDNLIPLNIRESVVADKENVFIHATKGDSWISYQTDDSKIKRFVLKQGRHIIIRGDVILLFIGNATASKIFYNNQLVEFKTSSGVKSLIFPKEQIKNFELPLFPSFKGVPYSANEYKERMVSEEN